MYPEKDDPMLLLLDAMMYAQEGKSTSEAIVQSEKRGQQKLVESEVLPKKFNYGTKKQFEDIGIVFGKDADDLFYYATLPDGWKKVATDHDMWSKLLDDKGRERASIFYKAAFDDRDAFLSITRRYGSSYMPVLGYDDPKYNDGGWVGVVTDGGSVIWKTEELEPEPSYKKDEKAWRAWSDKRNKLSEMSTQWLNDNYPDWENPTAYWG